MADTSYQVIREAGTGRPCDRWPRITKKLPHSAWRKSGSDVTKVTSGETERHLPAWSSRVAKPIHMHSICPSTPTARTSKGKGP